MGPSRSPVWKVAHMHTKASITLIYTADSGVGASNLDHFSPVPGTCMFAQALYCTFPYTVHLSRGQTQLHTSLLPISPLGFELITRKKRGEKMACLESDVKALLARELEVPIHEVRKYSKYETQNEGSRLER